MLVTKVDDPRADWLVLASPHNRNALSEQLLNELIDGVRQSAKSTRRALVIDHEGKAFCSGVDLRERSAGDERPGHSALLSTLLRELWTFPKPVVGRVDGLVRGGGMALLACCDLVVASDASNFGYSEVRVGVVPALVMAVTFPKLSTGHVGPWMLTGAPFGADEARRMGLVTRSVGRNSEVTIEPELDAIASGGPAAVALTKRLLRHETTDRVINAIGEMERVSHEIFQTAEAVEGMTAFTAKRSPSWR